MAGDFVQTSGDLANAQRIAAAEAENAKAAFGQAFQPIATAATNFATDALLAFRSLGGDEVATASIRFRENLQAINDATPGTDKLLTFQNALLNFARDAQLTAGEVLAFASAAGATIEDADAFATSLGQMAREAGAAEEDIAEMEAAIRATDPAAAAAAGEIEDLADETKDLAQSAQDARQAQLDLANQLKGQADPVFRAVSALQSYQATLQGIDEDGERTAEELLDLASAVLDTEGALRELAAGDLEGGILAIATALGISATEASALLTELGLLDGTSVSSVVDIEYRQRVTGTVPGTNVITSGGGTYVPPDIGRRAAGGPVTAGRPYLVGEAGAELFVPSASGTIVPNSQMGGSQPAQRTLQVVFNNSQLANDPMEGVRAAFAFDSLEGVA